MEAPFPQKQGGIFLLVELGLLYPQSKDQKALESTNCVWLAHQIGNEEKQIDK